MLTPGMLGELGRIRAGALREEARRGAGERARGPRGAVIRAWLGTHLMSAGMRLLEGR